MAWDRGTRCRCHGFRVQTKSIIGGGQRLMFWLLGSFLKTSVVVYLVVMTGQAFEVGDEAIRKRRSIT